MPDQVHRSASGVTRQLDRAMAVIAFRRLRARCPEQCGTQSDGSISRAHNAPEAFANAENITPTRRVLPWPDYINGDLDTGIARRFSSQCVVFLSSGQP